MTCRHGNSYFARSTKCDVICFMARNLPKTPAIANSSSNRIEFFGHFSRRAPAQTFAGTSLVAKPADPLRPRKSHALDQKLANSLLSDFRT
jgi:hypothetical protein